MECILLGFSVHGIFQARLLDWVAFPSSGNLPDPGMEPRYPALQAASLPFEPARNPKIRQLFGLKTYFHMKNMASR